MSRNTYIESNRNRKMIESFEHIANRCTADHLPDGRPEGQHHELKANRFERTNQPNPTIDFRGRGIFSAAASAKGNRKMIDLVETMQNLFLRSITKVAHTGTSGTAGTGGTNGRQSGSWLSPSRPAGVFAKMLALFMAVGFSGQTLAQEAVQTPVPMIDTTQFNALFNILLAGFGVNIAGKCAMYRVLLKRIDESNTRIDSVKDHLNTRINSVEALIVKNETQNQKEHAALEKQNQKEHATLEMKIKEAVGQSKANVLAKVHQLDNTVHKLIGQLEGARLNPNTGTASQTGSQEGVQTATT